jgi:hypothetical protein
MGTFQRGVQYDGTWAVYAGDSNRERVEFTAGGVPWDLTGAVVTAQARKVDTDPLVALEAVVEMTDPLFGVVHLSWDGEAVRALLAGSSTWDGVYDIQVAQAGVTSTLMRGRMKAMMDVTRVSP